jgi:hypothetical protein
MAVEVGRTPVGLEYAQEGRWRVLRHADGSHSEHFRVEGGPESWWLTAEPGEMPAAVRERLLAALGLDAADEPQVGPRKAEG